VLRNQSCIADVHRTCGKIKPLDVAAKGIKSATMFEDFASEVKYLIDTASKVREENQNRTYSVQKIYQPILGRQCPDAT
jgi:hypothetical protein